MPQSNSVALPSRLPLTSRAETRDETGLKDAKIVNAYLEYTETLETKTLAGPKTVAEVKVYKRPGLLQTGVTQVGNGYGVYNWQGDIYAIFGATMYKNGVALSGTLDTTGGVYRFSQSLGATLRMQFGNGVASYNYDANVGIVKINPLLTITAGSFVVSIVYTILTVGTTNFTLIGAASNTIGIVFTATGVGAGTGTATTPGNFPATCVKGWAYLDATTYVMDATGSIRGCAIINDTTLWTDLLNRLSAQIEADAGVALAKQLVYVIALGEWSTEVFYDAINVTGSPLSPAQNAKLNYGCASADSVQEIEGRLIWASSTRASGVQVILMQGLKEKIVSTKAIDKILSKASMANIYSFSFCYEGHSFYGITLVSSNVTLVYDIIDDEWAYWTDTNGNYFPVVSVTYSTTLGRILQHATNGKLYLCDRSYTSDDGTMITVDLYLPIFDAGTRRSKQLNAMEFVGDQTAGSILQVRHNDFDYQASKWTNYRKVDLNLRRPRLANLGTFSSRGYHFRHQCNTTLRIRAVELQMDIGTL